MRKRREEVTACRKLLHLIEKMDGRSLANKSRESIVNALFSLMEKKEFESISVQEITKEAKVARLTFYRHFQSKEDVLRYHLLLRFERFELDISSQKVSSLEEALAECFRYWKQSKDEILLFPKNHLDSLLYEPFQRYLEEMLRMFGVLDRFSEIEKSFLVGGIYFSMLRYLKEEGVAENEAARKIFSLLRL